MKQFSPEYPVKVRQGFLFAGTFYDRGAIIQPGTIATAKLHNLWMSRKVEIAEAADIKAAQEAPAAPPPTDEPPAPADGEPATDAPDEPPAPDEAPVGRYAWHQGFGQFWIVEGVGEAMVKHAGPFPSKEAAEAAM